MIIKIYSISYLNLTMSKIDENEF